MLSIPGSGSRASAPSATLNAGWYFQSDTMPKVSEMQAQHDALVAALEAKGVEVHRVEGVDGGRLKSCYTRDPLIMVRGGAIVCRMGTRVRRGEELAITRTLAKLGVPILRTLSGSALMEGGSFAWINEKTAVIGCGIRVNREGAEQVGEVLKRQGVDFLVIDLFGYDLHIDGSFQMIGKDLAIVDPFGLPFSFLREAQGTESPDRGNFAGRRQMDHQFPGGCPGRTFHAARSHQPDPRCAGEARGELDRHSLWQDATQRRRHPLFDDGADPRSGLRVGGSASLPAHISLAPARLAAAAGLC